jgi:hypothetical protein
MKDQFREDQSRTVLLCGVRPYVDKGVISGSIILELCFYSVRTYVDEGITDQFREDHSHSRDVSLR